ncbi:hypothetical protein [Streptomyces sp. CB00072]|uniref:hypothetical protein n=1 Tax=Streptomyces sp. CB00072 TaxID=1703928 RepID=UPI0018EA2569|nr:hypothetical protein [Streptomyces sp. CB00072]
MASGLPVNGDVPARGEEARAARCRSESTFRAADGTGAASAPRTSASNSRLRKTLTIWWCRGRALCETGSETVLGDFQLLTDVLEHPVRGCQSGPRLESRMVMRVVEVETGASPAGGRGDEFGQLGQSPDQCAVDLLDYARHLVGRRVLVEARDHAADRVRIGGSAGQVPDLQRLVGAWCCAAVGEPDVVLHGRTDGLADAGVVLGHVCLFG